MLLVSKTTTTDASAYKKRNRTGKYFTLLPAAESVVDPVLSHDQMHPGTPAGPRTVVQYGKDLLEIQLRTSVGRLLQQ